MIPKVLIVILNYKTYQMTLALIDQLKNLDYPSFEIMVVDNCSPNESVRALEQYANLKGYILYENNKNAGYAVGNNIGIRYGIDNGYEYTWILNNDVRIKEPSVLSKMVQAAQTDPNIGCVGTKIFDADGRICAPYCSRPNLWTMTLGIVKEKKRRQKQIDISQQVYRLHGCSMLLRNSVMKKINCFDERTFLFGEEEILSEKMRKIGAFAYYLADCSIIHMESSTIDSISPSSKKNKIRYTMESMKLYLREYRHYGLIAQFLCLTTRRLIMKYKR